MAVFTGRGGSSDGGGGLQLIMGSYVGTGAAGASNPNSITFAVPPELVFLPSINCWNLDNSGVQADNNVGGTPLVIYMDQVPLVFRTDGYPSYIIGDGYNTAYIRKSGDGRTLYWYAATSYSQLNTAGITYLWAALCRTD